MTAWVNREYRIIHLLSSVPEQRTVAKIHKSKYTYTEDKELRKLSRQELIELLSEVTKENEKLKSELAETKKQLDSKWYRLGKAGNIADAALEMNGVFEKVQRAANEYICNIKVLEVRRQRELQEVLEMKEKLAEKLGRY